MNQIEPDFCCFAQFAEFRKQKSKASLSSMSSHLFLWVCLHDPNLWVAELQAVILLFWQLFRCAPRTGKLESCVQWLGLRAVNIFQVVSYLQAESAERPGMTCIITQGLRYGVDFCSSWLRLGSHEFLCVYLWVVSMRLLNSKIGVFIQKDKF